MTDKKRATINVTMSFKKDLDKMKLANESYEEVLKREIGGYRSRLENIKEPVAFDLKGEYTNQIEFETVKVHWSSLYKSKVGDFWAVPNNENCIFRQTASVIYRDDDVVIVKFKTYYDSNIDIEIRSYNFFSESF